MAHSEGKLASEPLTTRLEGFIRAAAHLFARTMRASVTHTMRAVMLLYPRNPMHHGYWMKTLAFGTPLFLILMMVGVINGTKQPFHG